jgi:hypothetical protein
LKAFPCETPCESGPQPGPHASDQCNLIQHGVADLIAKERICEEFSTVSSGAVLVASSRLGAAVFEEINQRLLEGFIHWKVPLEEYQDRLSGLDASFIALHERRQLFGD